MFGPTSHSYYSQRLRLHYLDYGNPDAPPLLLIHGSRDHAHNWDWLAERFRDRFHVVAPDLRGHGDSQWSVGASYLSSEYVYDIAQLVDQQQLFPLRIVSHSLGGNVALRYVGVFPERVDRLVVIEGLAGTLKRPDPLPPMPDRLRTFIDTKRSIAARTPRRYPTLEDAYRRMHEENPHLTAEQARHLTIHGANQNEDGTYTWKFDNHVSGGHVLDMSSSEARELWWNITCPVLHITGSESKHQEGIESKELLADFRDGRHAVVGGAGHWVHHDQLDRVVALLDDFL